VVVDVVAVVVGHTPRRSLIILSVVFPPVMQTSRARLQPHSPSQSNEHLIELQGSGVVVVVLVVLVLVEVVWVEVVSPGLVV